MARPPSSGHPRSLALSVRILVSHLHHARVGVTAKTLANHKSNVRAALRWFSKEHDVPQRGARLSAEWEKFLDALDAPHALPPFQLMRYCSARRDRPVGCQRRTSLTEYWRYRTETTGRATDNTARRFMVRAWNGICSCHRWLARCPRLAEPAPIKRD